MDGGCIAQGWRVLGASQWPALKVSLVRENEGKSRQILMGSGERICAGAFGGPF